MARTDVAGRREVITVALLDYPLETATQQAARIEALVNPLGTDDVREELAALREFWQARCGRNMDPIRYWQAFEKLSALYRARQEPT